MFCLVMMVLEGKRLRLLDKDQIKGLLLLCSFLT